jgi:hypothetical protein
MIRRILGVLLVIGVVSSIPLVVLGVTGATQFVDEVNDKLRDAEDKFLGPLQTNLQRLRDTLTPIWKDLQDMATDIQTAANTLKNGLTALTSFDVRLPKLTLSASIPSITLQEDQVSGALLNIYVITGVNFFSGSVTDKYIVVQMTNQTFTITDPGLSSLLKNIPGLQQSKTLFENIKSFLGEASANVRTGVAGMIRRITDVFKPLQALDNLINEFEIARKQIESLRKAWEGRFATFFTLCGGWLVLMYIVGGLTVLWTGWRMVTGNV